MGRKQTEETKRKIGEASRKRFANGMSAETRAKMSASHKGKKRSAEFCLKNGERTKGKKYSLGTRRNAEQRMRMSLSAKKGPENHAWRGGITEENNKLRRSLDAQIWKFSVFERDGWKCRKCDKGGGFNAHHIQNFHDHPELRFEVSNGITLCDKCHREFHSRYGRLKNNEYQVNLFLGIYPALPEGMING